MHLACSHVRFSYVTNTPKCLRSDCCAPSRDTFFVVPVSTAPSLDPLSRPAVHGQPAGGGACAHKSTEPQWVRGWDGVLHES